MGRIFCSSDFESVKSATIGVQHCEGWRVQTSEKWDKSMFAAGPAEEEETINHASERLNTLKDQDAKHKLNGFVATSVSHFMLSFSKS